MKKTKRIIIIATLILSMLLVNFSVFAADPVAITGGNTIAVTRKIEGVTNPVTATFSYEITRTETTPTGVTGTPTVSDIAFTNATPDASNEVTAQGSIDLSGLTFTEPGIYTWVITETASSVPDTYPASPDGQNSYEFQVQVVYEGDGASRHLVATVVNKVKAEGANTKTDDIIFPVPAEFVYLTLTKTVTGDMGDQSHPFEFTVNVAGNTGDTYTVTGGTSNPATITANTDTVLKAKHGETITIGKNGNLNQIIRNSTYTITESDTAAAPYTTTIDGNEETDKAVTKTASADVNATAVVNDYSNSVDTGVFLNIAPFVALIILALVGIVMIKKTSNKE